MTSPQRRAREREVARNDAALLEAARRAFARDGVRTTVGAVAAAAGVGVGTLYRRYASKTALLERLLVLSNQQWLTAVGRAQEHPDPWRGLRDLVVEAAEYGQGTLAPLGRMAVDTAGFASSASRADAEFEDLIARAHRSGGLRREVTSIDVLLLIEQLGRSPLVEQVEDLDDAGLAAEARDARRRLIDLALDGIAAGPRDEPRTSAPDPRLLTARWRPPRT